MEMRKQITDIERAIKDIKESRKLYGLTGSITDEEIKFMVKFNKLDNDDDVDLFLCKEFNIEPDIKVVRRVKLKKIKDKNEETKL